MSRYLSIYLRPRENGAPVRLEPVADWSRRFTPLAAPDAPDGVILDIAGAAHLFGGEAAMMAHVEQELARRGLPARGAIASTPEAAIALARYGEAPAARRMIADGADERAIFRAVSTLLVQSLRLDEATCTALSQSGLKRIGDIWLRPRAPLAARFGKQLFATLDAMMGRTRSAISPRFEAPAYVAERRFVDGVVAREHIEDAIAALARDLSGMLEHHREGARKLMAALFRVDGKVMRVDCTTSRPQRDANVIARLFREKIEALAQNNEHDPLEAGYGFDLIRLGVMEAEPLAIAQQRIADQTEPEPEPHALADFLDRMRARFGAHNVMQFVANDTHVPEYAVAPVFSSRPPTPTPRPSPQAGRGGDRGRGLFSPPRQSGEGQGVGQMQMQEQTQEQALGPLRPLRLFEKPEPVEAMALVPDGPPLRFRWRRAMHEVAAFEGPERIAPEWWKGQENALTRDYFRVEDTRGRRFWLFREGLYERETARPRWFMQGLFG